MIDLDAIQAELTYIADRAKDVAYRGDVEWLTSVWASVGKHVPELLAEMRQLRAERERDAVIVDAARAWREAGTVWSDTTEAEIATADAALTAAVDAHPEGGQP